MKADGQMRIGDRGMEMLGLMYRLGGLTARQYARFASPVDDELSEQGRHAVEAKKEKREARVEEEKVS